MIDGDDDHVALPAQSFAVGFDFVARAARVRAAVEPDHDGTLPVIAETGRPDIEMQAVFAHRPPAGRRLRCDGPELQRVADAGPRLGRDRREKTAPARVGAIANSFEDVNAGVGATAPLALRGIESRHAGLRA